MLNKDYIKTLKERGKQSHVYKKFQLTGLLIAQLLGDEKHKSLYIKLAKKHNNEHLLSIAKDVAERKRIENKGGYFMRVLTKTHPDILSADLPAEASAKAGGGSASGGKNRKIKK